MQGSLRMIGGCCSGVKNNNKRRERYLNMKKSFLKRAMAAAIAVPVALTQTLVCATGFAAEDTAATAGAIALTAADLMAVEADTAKNVPVLIEETDTTRTYKQESTWNDVAYGALAGSVGTVVDLDTQSLADAVTKDAWFMDLLKDALVNGGSAVAEITADKNVVATINLNYNYAAEVEKALEAKLDNADITLDTAPITGTITLTANTSELANGTVFGGTAKAVIDGQEMDAEAAIEYARTKLAEVRAQAEETVKAVEEYDANAAAEAAAEVAALFDSYEAKLDKAQAKYDKVMEVSKEKSYEADSYNEVLAAVKAEYADNAYVGKVPNTISEALSNATAAALFENILGQVNAALDTYTLDFNLDEIATIAEGMYAVSVYGAVNAGNVDAATAAMTADDITADELAALKQYFIDIEAAKGLAIVSFTTEKMVDVTANATVADLSGEADVRIERLISYEVAPEEETTTTTSETTTDTTETTVDSTSGSDETTTDTDDSTSGSDETTTETNDSTSGSDETTTETNDSTSGSDETTTDTNDSTSDTGESSTTETTAVITITAVAKPANFYFSHDDTVLTGEMLLESASMVVTVDGVAGDAIDVLDNIQFGYTTDEPDTGLTPEQIYKDNGEPYTALPIYAFYVDPDNADAEPILVNTSIKIYVGVKGDATLDGAANAADAANILMYAASAGAGNSNPKLFTEEYTDVENFAFFLADVNTELKEETPTELNAADAAKVLMYAAWEGALATAPANGDIKAKWNELIA